MSIGHRRYPESENLFSKEQVVALMEELDRATKVADLVNHEGWEIVNDELTKRELSAMQALTYGSAKDTDVAFNRALAQICRYLREMPSRSQQQRETLQGQLDSIAPRNGGK